MAADDFLKNDPENGPPPSTLGKTGTHKGLCVPVVDRSCTTACDCKFYWNGCGYGAANISWPWSVCFGGGGPGPDGEIICQEPNYTEPMMVGCDGVGLPWPGEASVGCVEGLCTAFGPSAVNSYYVPPE